MRTRLVPVLALTATALTTAPAAFAAPVPSPTPTTGSPRTAQVEATEVGGLRIHKKDPEGRSAAGAAFQLLDTAGKTLADGKTSAEGTLTFTGIAPGIARLKEVNSGSPLLGTVPDQDVVITPGEPTDLQITDPYKPAELTLKATDKTTGKGLAGAVVNIAPKGAKDAKGTFTLTTGKDGTAKPPLPVGKKTGTTYTATETKAPAGHRLQTAPVDVTATPGASVTISLTNIATNTAPPTQNPTERPISRPTESATDQPTPGSSQSASASPTGAVPSSSSSTSPGTTVPASPTAGAEPTGSLANTGSTYAPPCCLSPVASSSSREASPSTSPAAARRQSAQSSFPTPANTDAPTATDPGVTHSKASGI